MGKKRAVWWASGILTAFCAVTCVFGAIRDPKAGGGSAAPSDTVDVKADTRPLGDQPAAPPVPPPLEAVPPLAPPPSEQSPLKGIFVLVGSLALLLAVAIKMSWDFAKRRKETAK